MLGDVWLPRVGAAVCAAHYLEHQLRDPQGVMLAAELQDAAAAAAAAAAGANPGSDCAGAAGPAPAGASKTGGAGAGSIPASVSQDLAWPPATIFGVPPESVTALPQYTSTATPATLPFPDPTPAPALKAQHGDGWANKQDTAPAVGPINGCAYPNAYGGADLQIPASGCVPAANP